MFVPESRRQLLERLREKRTWDILVIGGGATGLGTALDAAARGYSTLLLEARDFGHGTSSRSTKLIHGGVRYLATGQLGMVRESLRERGLLLANAPTLVHKLPFLVPCKSALSQAYYHAGLWLYDRLSGRHGIGPSQSLSASKVESLSPGLDCRSLHGAILYWDAQFDDARLITALARALFQCGGLALNYTPVVSYLKSSHRITGVIAADFDSGSEFQIHARAIVNATGVFADALRALDNQRVPPLLRPSRGIHLVLDRSLLPGDAAVLIPHTTDGRVLFAIPWLDRVLLGTTDVPVEAPEHEPRPSSSEIQYLLEHAEKVFRTPPKLTDVRSAFAGLRPLIGPANGRLSTASLSREHAIIVDPSGLITVAGGKWTTYRLMAQQVVDRAVKVAGLAKSPCVTEKLPLATPDEPQPASPSDMPLDQALDLDPGDLLHPALPYKIADVVRAARQEWAMTVEDVLSRRLRALIMDAAASLQAAPLTARILAHELGKDSAWEYEQIRQFEKLSQDYLPEALLSSSPR